MCGSDRCDLPGIKAVAAYSKIPQNRAMTIARTEAHRIQSNATADAQFKAKEKGADIVKEWISILDERTRPSHQKLNGQIRELEDSFEVDGHKVMRPGACACFAKINGNVIQ